MAKEIERKFLVHPRKWSDLGAGLVIRQGYLCTSKQCSVRVRTYGDHAYVTIKGATSDITRDEYEYEIPLNDANEILRQPLRASADRKDALPDRVQGPHLGGR